MPVNNVNANLGNVPMDYFLRGASAAKPQGAAPAGPIAAEAEANPAEAPEQNPVVKLGSQLDVLLLKAAKASTKSLDGDISVRKQNGRTKRIGGQVAMNVHLLDCPSYFTRDYFDKIFA